MTVSSARLIELLGTLYPFGQVYGYVLLLNFEPVEYGLTTGSFDLTNNTIDAAGNNYVVGTRVAFNGSLPSELETGVIYYVVTTGSSIQVSDRPGGTPIDFSDAGFGAMTMIEADPVSQSGGVINAATSLTDLVRWEVGYEGQGTRPAWTPATPVYDDSNHSARLPRSGNFVEVDNTSGSNPISANTLVVLEGGSATRGNTTGTIDDIIPFGRTVVIPANAPNITRLTISKVLNG